MLRHSSGSNIPVGKISATEGPNNASVEYFKITVKGRGAHVSNPEKGIDALFVASEIVCPPRHW